MKLYFISPLISQKIIRTMVRPIFLYLGHWKISGIENLKGVSKPIIFACNHTSEMDPFFVPASLPFFSRFSPIFYTSREKSFYNGSGWRRHFYGGLFFKILGSYPVTVGLKDYEKSMRHQIEILRDGGSLCIYPEGGITPDGSIQPAKGGIAYLSYITNAKIVPVRLVNTYRLSFSDLINRRRNISITYGKPMESKDVLGSSPSMDDFKNYANVIMSEIGKL